MPLAVTVLAALWVTLVRCDVSESPGPGCDNGKALPSIDTVYDPEPARQICMDKAISYNHDIPNSGAYRPVMAESGEYLYCPPQRWLNNLHHAATVLLYHPCAPLHERLLLSVLARSCLTDYIISPHPQLSKHTPIALVAWGRTLQLSTVSSPDVCDWLENTTSTRNKSGGPSRKYDLLLTRSAEQHLQQHAHPEEHSAKTKESLRRCCEQTISPLLNGAMESNMGKKDVKQLKEGGKRRMIRAALQSNRTTLNRTEDAQSYNSSLGPTADSHPGNRTLSDPPGPREVSSQSMIQNMNQSLTPRPTTSLGSNDSLGFGAGLHVLADGVKSEQKHTARTEALAHSSKDEGTDSVKHHVKEDFSKEKHSADGTMKDNEVVDVKERELEHKQTLSDTHSHDKSEKTSFDSVSKSQSESPNQPQQHPNPQPATYLPNNHDYDGCEEGKRCEYNNSGSEARASVVNMGVLRTRRTDEAVWAAAALGFLLVLLTLSVLHTRLYRHWRTTPSLYWHDPQKDYDSVAEFRDSELEVTTSVAQISRP
ncbi:hypothetical protein D9C73_015432 [Collichthys lucidus]|uniref:Tumor protein p53-inducible protein 13 n=1 Tax=Collichthys lucidus TaxID=240159 RepID=A0A4U5V0V9_COLLU|nr:hypothetical protein D9C73_015432 [Collichthys lucidus]